MEAHNVSGPRPARAIAACVALGLALAAVMLVLYPALRANQGLAGDRDYEAILGSAPSPGAGARILQTDARAMDSGTRSATANAVQPGDPAAYPVEAEAKPLETPAPTATGTSDAAVQDTSSSLQSDADLSTFDGARAATDLKPSLPEDKGDPVATVSGWFSEPAKDRGISPLTTATITPSDDGKLCEWTYELIDAKDANSDGVAEEVEGAVLFYHTYDIGDDGTREYQGVAIAHVKTVDADSDTHNESALFEFAAYEQIDMNLDGHPEAARGLCLEMSATDANSSGIPEAVCLEIAAGAYLG